MLIQKLKEIFPDLLLEISEPLGETTMLIKKQNLKKVALVLKDNEGLKFEQLIDLSAVDFLYHDKPSRFQMVYHFLSITYQHRVRIKCLLNENDTKIDSLCEFWECANWYERECYDMYGIEFVGHPDLRRILMYDEFEGHPLRKDYSITHEQPRIPLKDIKERKAYMQKQIYEPRRK